MVRVYGPAMSIDASGTLASTIVFSKWKGRNYIRERVIPANPKSGGQVGMRACFAWLTQQWASIAAGEPVWFKVDPPAIPPGHVGQVVVRLRQRPERETLHLGLKHAGGIVPVTALVQPDHPRVAGVGLAPALDAVYLYFRHPAGGKRAPSKILLDGVDVTASALIGQNCTVDTIPAVVRLGAPCGPGVGWRTAGIDGLFFLTVSASQS